MTDIITFVESLGFTSVTRARTKSDPQEVRGCHYVSYSAERLHQKLGEAKFHKAHFFIFILNETKTLRVDTSRKVVLIGNGQRARRAFLRSVDKQ